LVLPLLVAILEEVVQQAIRASKDRTTQEARRILSDEFACFLLWLVLGIVLAGLYHGHPFLEMFLFGIAHAVAVVPEALPAVITISLGIGVQRLVRRNALMRRLPAVETLGSTSVICSDKTGTLTRDEMTVREIHVAGRTWSVSGSGYDPVGEFSDEGQATALPAVLRKLLEAVRAGTSYAFTRFSGAPARPGDGGSVGFRVDTPPPHPV